MQHSLSLHAYWAKLNQRQPHGLGFFKQICVHKINCIITYCFVIATDHVCTMTSSSNGLPGLEMTQVNYFYMLSHHWPTYKYQQTKLKIRVTLGPFFIRIPACVTLDHSFVLTRFMMKIQQSAENNAEGAGMSSPETASQTSPGQSFEWLYQECRAATGISQGFSCLGQWVGCSNCLKPEQGKEASPAMPRLPQAAWRVFSTTQLFSTAQLRSSLLNAFSWGLHPWREATQHNLLCPFSQRKTLHFPFRKGRKKSKGHIFCN